MCGIAAFSGSFPEVLIQTMTDVQTHRGPDADATWLDPANGIALGHRRLSIIDLSPTGNQPMLDNDGPGVIAFNGEIYNYRELRHELEKDGATFQSTSDTEVILKLYAREGRRMLTRLNGIFAFALWDRVRKTMLVARDGLGVKPLYYAQPPEGFVLASELKALINAPGVDLSLDPVAAYDYLSYLWSPGTRTMAKGIKKLEPGHAMWIENGLVKKIHQFYELPYDSPAMDLDYEATKKKVTDTLRTAVRRQLVADVPVGAFLSGGLDSSAVVALAREADPVAAQDCFTIRFKGSDKTFEGSASDYPYACKAASHLGVTLHEVEIGPEMIDHLKDMLWHMDEPQADPAAINVFLIAQKARELGIKVLLSGAGGDDIFTGYRRHVALNREKLWAWLPAFLRKALRDSVLGLGAGSALSRRLQKAFLYAHGNGDQRIAGYFRWLTPELAASLFSNNFREAIRSERQSDPLVDSLTRGPTIQSRLSRMLFLEGKHFLADHNLNYTDKMSMAHGVEVRVPLLDQDLVALAARLPDFYKLHGNQGKRIFKSAMESYLPKEIIYRPKTGFGAPIRTWLKRELRPLLSEQLSESALKKHGIFDPAGVQRLIELDRSGRIDAAYPIFAVLCIELWCSLFLEGNGIKKKNG